MKHGPPLSKASSQRSTAAFTLIELLVVIAIIAVLAALLLSALARARAQANSAKCKSSLHLLGLALNLYLEDNSSKYPYGGYWYRLSPSQRLPLNWWEMYLQPYYGFSWTNNPGFQCPGYKGPTTFFTSTGGQAGSFAYNSWGTGYFQQKTVSLGLTGDGYENEVWPATKASSLMAPADMFAIGESRLLTNGDFSPPMLAGWDLMVPGVSPALILNTPLPERHGKNYNQLFCDGHVEAIPLMILLNPTNSAVRWNKDHQPHPETWWSE